VTSVGARIENYRVVRELGQGGMGRILLCFDEKLKREVILKSLKTGQMDDLARARFLREARAMSQLDHTNICRIFGYVESDLNDFLVLEYIKGKNLRKFIGHRTTFRTKVRLAEEIARALVAAHKAGIVHRDLKLDNVMVDSGGEVKVLDFGLALLGDEPDMPGSDLDVRVMPPVGSVWDEADRDSSAGQTLRGSITGTVAAMSPEQARGQRGTACSDMYSFGLLLQELFTGDPVYDLGLSNPKILIEAAEGRTAPVQGVDPQVTQLIEDLKSFTPQARPTAIKALKRLTLIRNRVRKRVWRMIALITLLLVSLGSLKYTADLRRLKRESDLARKEAEQVSSFLIEIFEVSNPGESRGRTVTARELLDRAQTRIDSSFADETLIQANLMQTIGEVFEKLGLYADAERNLEKALEIHLKQMGDDDPRVVKSINRLGWVKFRQGQFEESESLYRWALEIQDESGVSPLDMAETLHNLSVVNWQQGRNGEAEPYALQALDIRQSVLGPTHPDIANSLNNLAIVYRRMGRLNEALDFSLRSLEMRERSLGLDHPDIAISLNSLGVIHRNLGQFDDAKRYFQRALDLWENSLGPDHNTVASSLNNLGYVHWWLGDYQQAGRLLERALEIRERTLDPGHLKNGFPLNALGLVRWKQGHLEEAHDLLTRALEIFETHLEPRDPLIAAPLSGLGGVYRDLGRFEDAERCFVNALAIRGSLPDDHPDLVHTKQEYAILLRALGRDEEAQRLETRR